MNSKERREAIVKRLMESNAPIKGIELAKEFGITRQIIVKDIAILRAECNDIIATPEGYILSKRNKDQVRRILALCHKREEIGEELEAIVKYGGIIEDVVVEHPLYGEIKAMLMIRTLHDIQNFVDKFCNAKAEPLSALTGGVHIHTICASSEDAMDKIIKELKLKKFLVCD